MKKSQFKISGFTLVELIIVITILAILATIAFMSFQNFSKDARDGNRVTTLKSIEKGIDLYAIKNTTLPTPEGVTTKVMGSGSTGPTDLWTKGEVGDEISRKISLNKTPKDPNNKNQNYIYAVTPRGEYQVATTLENLQANAIIPVTYANNSKAKVSGNYKPRFFETETMAYFIPSLIFTSEINGELKLNDSNAKIYYVTDDDTNLPYDIGNNTSANKTMTGLNLVQDIINKVKDKLTTQDDKGKIENYFTQTGTGKTGSDPIYDTIKETTGSSQSSNQAQNQSPTTINGVCGTANKSYENTETTFGTDTFCDGGIPNPTTPTFPTQGNTVNWTCNSPDGGNPAICSATKLNPNEEIVSCTGKPANSVYFGSSETHDVTVNYGSPAPTANYTETPSENSCDYSCATNYTWNGTSCALNQQNPTNLSLSHSTRSKTFTFSWTAGVGNGGSCKLQYDKNGTWTNISEITYNCDTTLSNQSVTLPGDGWYSGNWNGVQVRVIRTSDSIALGSPFTQTLSCSTTSASSSSTPTIDEDCNGVWDNYTTNAFTRNGTTSCTRYDNIYYPYYSCECYNAYGHGSCGGSGNPPCGSGTDLSGQVLACGTVSCTQVPQYYWSCECNYSGGGSGCPSTSLPSCGGYTYDKTGESCYNNVKTYNYY